MYLINVYLFQFYNNDSIVIHTLAALDDEWIAYKKSDEMRVRARVTDHDYMSFMGLQDSVKTIAFQCFDMEMNPIDNNVNGMKIKISKNYGLISAISFYYFPTFQYYGWYNYQKLQEVSLVGISEPEVGIQNLTWYDVYDFQVGDIIHVFKESGIWFGNEDGQFGITETKLLYTYLERTDYADSIKYTYSLVKEVQHSGSGIITLSADTLSAIIKANPAFDKLPFEPAYHNYIDIPEHPSSFDYYEMRHEPHISKWIHNYWFAHYEGNCWYELHFDGVSVSRYYLKGLGGPYYPYSALFGGVYHEEPVYYRKGEQSWGTPLILTDINEIFSNNQIKVYPNPARDKVFINVFDIIPTKLTLTLFDINGRVILSTPLEQGENILNTGDLNSGFYFYTVGNKERIFKIDKLVIKQ